MNDETKQMFNKTVEKLEDCEFKKYMIDKVDMFSNENMKGNLIVSIDEKGDRFSTATLYSNTLNFKNEVNEDDKKYYVYFLLRNPALTSQYAHQELLYVLLDSLRKSNKIVNEINLLSVHSKNVYENFEVTDEKHVFDGKNFYVHRMTVKNYINAEKLLTVLILFASFLYVIFEFLKF